MEKFHELLECLSSNDYQVNYAIAKVKQLLYNVQP